MSWVFWDFVDVEMIFQWEYCLDFDVEFDCLQMEKVDIFFWLEQDVELEY